MPQTSAFEHSANIFAIHILMPANVLKDFIHYSNYKVEQIADIFDVSYAALRYRLKELHFL